jgi:hypothetical protein
MPPDAGDRIDRLLETAGQQFAAVADEVEAARRRGRRVMVWTTTRANHFHDCRIYAMAAFHRAAQMHGVTDDIAAAWSRLEAKRRPGRPQGELVLDREAIAAVAPAAATTTPRTTSVPSRGGWKPSPARVGGFVKNWRL